VERRVRARAINIGFIDWRLLRAFPYRISGDKKMYRDDASGVVEPVSTRIKNLTSEFRSIHYHYGLFQSGSRFVLYFSRLERPNVVLQVGEKRREMSGGPSQEQL